MQFIDIHTHNDFSDDEVIYIRNYITGVDDIKTDKAFSMGIHPWFLDTDIRLLEKSAEENKNTPNWKALGECGMDFMPVILEKSDKKTQEKFFIQQIKLAEKYQKALLIHCVKCFDSLLKIKKENSTNTAWIIHGYTKNKSLAKQLSKAGFYLSFGAHLFESSVNREALIHTRLNRIFLETDEQKQYRIQEIYQLVAELKNVSLHELKKQIFTNYTSVL